VRLTPVDLKSERIATAIRNSVRSAKRRGAHPNVFYLTVAEIVIAECMRRKPSSAASEQFFDRPKTGAPVHWQYQSRILAVADTLFAIRDIEGFDIHCKRLRDQDVRASFYEGFAARMFLQLGFSVKVRPPTGRKGEDFDFLATKDTTTINVEVTTLAGERYSSVTVENALEKKRKQLPADGPGVIFVVPPESWYEPGHMEMQQTLRDDAERFVQKTERINAIVYLGEEHNDFGLDRRGWLGFHFDACLHSVPRFPVPELDRFLDGTLSDPAAVSSAEKLSDLETLRTVNQSGFFDWAEAFWNEK
jgi:hypothetical protein